MNALDVLCAQLTRDVFAIAKFLLLRVSILTRDIDIANLSVRPSVCYVPVSDKNDLTYRHSFSPYGSPFILVLPASNMADQ